MTDANGVGSSVMSSEALRLFDLLYEGAWHLMGGARVLGETRQSMRETYANCLVEGSLPFFWFELPLKGDPHSDLHVSYDYSQVRPPIRFLQGAGYGYEGLFDWFAEHGTPGSGIDYTVDLTNEGVGAVGAYVSFRDAARVDLEGFCASLGRAEDAPRCRRLVELFPQGWNVWYASPFPGRAGNPVRAAALVSQGLRKAFAHNSTLVREHFEGMGLSSVTDELCRRVSALASLPIDLELRVAMNEDGTLSERFDVSFYLTQGHMYAADRARAFGEGGAGHKALAWFEQWGIADERWRAVAGGGFSRAVSFARDDDSACRVALLCSPTCFMMPWQAGEPLPAKSYPKLQARFM